MSKRFNSKYMINDSVQYATVIIIFKNISANQGIIYSDNPEAFTALTVLYEKVDHYCCNCTV